VWISRTLAAQPFIAIFLVVAAGYALGRVTVKGLGLGSVASTLVIALGASFIAAERGIQFEIPELASTIFFNLFMFSVGMKVGPQFLAGMRRDAKNFILIGLFIPVAALGLILGVRALFDLSPGLVPGIFAGANTATPGLGAAKAVMSDREAIAMMSTAFAFAYCISTVLFAVLTRVPELLGDDTPAAARAYEASLKGSGGAPLPGTGSELFGGGGGARVRAFRVAGPAVAGRTLGQLRAAQPLLSVEGVRREGSVLPLADDLALREGDVVAVYGAIHDLLAAEPQLGPEVEDAFTDEVVSQTVDVVVHRREVVGKKLIDLAGNVGHGLFLNAMFRAGDEIPFGPETVARKGDVLRVTGSKPRIAALTAVSGTVVAPTTSTDIVTLALGVALGALLGLITVPLGSIHLQVGAAVGLLLLGIALSIARTRYPRLGGPYPESARQLFEDLGLNVFCAVLGLNAGSGVVEALQQGVLGTIILGTLVVGFVPPILAWFLGRYVLHMNQALLLGAVAGGRCNSAGMRASQEATHSNVPAISYPATFALSNVAFTLLCYVMALIEHA
jgi:putative transport protein